MTNYNKRRTVAIRVAAVAVLTLGAYRVGPQVVAALCAPDAPAHAPLADTTAATPGSAAGGAGRPVADFTVRTLDSQTVALTDLRGQVVLVNFWATWCSGCRSEMPGFQAAYQELAPRGFTILALSIDTGPEVVAQFMREHGYTFPVAMATDEARRIFAARGVPTSFLLDRNGRVRTTVPGVYHETDLRAAVEALLAEPQTGVALR